MEETHSFESPCACCAGSPLRKKRHVVAASADNVPGVFITSFYCMSQKHGFKLDASRYMSSEGRREDAVDEEVPHKENLGLSPPRKNIIKVPATAVQDVFRMLPRKRQEQAKKDEDPVFHEVDDDDDEDEDDEPPPLQVDLEDGWDDAKENVQKEPG